MQCVTSHRDSARWGPSLSHGAGENGNHKASHNPLCSHTGATDMPAHGVTQKWLVTECWHLRQGRAQVSMQQIIL